MDAVEAAQSGHPGTPMALAPAAYVLWHRVLRHHPHNPAWPDRDRFVLSCGHASMLLYALLYLTGYDLSLDDIRAFRQWGSKTAVGLAIAERLLADLMEGVPSEVASLAGHLRLAKLTLVYDDNHITIDGDTALTFSEDVQRRFEAYGWYVVRVGNGSDLEGISVALDTDRVRVRVVSMPSWELFAEQPEAYRESVLPSSLRVRVGVEAGSAFGWERWTTDDGAMVAMTGFGASAPGDRLFEEFNFTADRAASVVRRLLAERTA